MNNKPTTAEIVILAAGAAAVLFSFFDWLDFGFGGAANAWDSGLFPTYTLIAILGAVMAVVIVLEVFANTKLPEGVLGFTWPQLHLVLAVYAALLAVSFLLVDKSTADMAIGYFISLVAAIGLVVGAYMLGQERPAGVRTAPAAGPGPGMPPAAPQPPPPPPA